MICPCCQQTVSGVSPKGLHDVFVTPQEKIVLTQLVEAYPRRVSRDHLIEALYGHRPDGGALHSSNILSILIRKIRNKINNHGWTIPNSKGGKGNYGSYFIEPLDENFIPLGDAANKAMVGIVKPRKARKSKVKKRLIRYAGAE